MPSDDPKFACPSCGKHYRWKSEFAGRSAKCACGAKLVVPAEPPVKNPAASPPAPAPAAAGAPCPSCHKALPQGAVLCVNCGYNLKTGQTLSVIVEEDDEEEDEKVSGAPVTPEKGTASTG